MKISIQKQKVKSDGTQAIRVLYDYGYQLLPNGTRQRKREYESLDLFVYDKPETPTQRRHNKEQTQFAELLKNKRILEYQAKLQAEKQGIKTQNQPLISFMAYFQKQIDIKEKYTSSSTYSI